MQHQFVILALAACLGVVLSAPTLEDDNTIQGATPSSLPLIPTAEANIAQLVGPQKAFAPFCNQARELVLEKVSNEKDRLRTLVFNVLMNSGETLANEVASTLSNSVGQLGETLRDPSKPIPEIADPDEIQRKVTDAAKRIQDGENKSDLIASVTTVVSVVLSKAKQVLTDQFQRAKLLLKPDSMMLINDACLRLKSEYLDVVQNLFKSNRLAMMKTAKAEQDMNTISFLTYFDKMGNLQCGVVKRLMNLKLFCSIYTPAAPVFQEMWSSSSGSSDGSDF